MLACESRLAGTKGREHQAKIGAYLDQVVDAFHVTDEAGRKVVDPERLDRIRRALERVAAPVTGPGGG